MQGGCTILGYFEGRHLTHQVDGRGRPGGQWGLKPGGGTDAREVWRGVAFSVLGRGAPRGRVQLVAGEDPAITV